jgi:RecQ family ATP-dependent DNA helicase
MSHEFPTPSSPSKRRKLNESSSQSSSSSSSSSQQATQNDSQSIRTTLEQLFGFDDFREHQKEAIRATLAAKDVLLVMRPGSGKSLCYQLAAGHLHGITLVVSPTMSVIENQMHYCPFNCLRLRFDAREEEQQEMYSVLTPDRTDIQLLYVAPDHFQSQLFQEKLNMLFTSGLLVRVVIDEVHRISMLSHDFRIDYTKLCTIKSQWNVPIMAVTSTATQIVQQDIIKQLQLSSDCCVFTSSLSMPNLIYSAKKKKGLLSGMDKFILKHCSVDSGIIYCPPFEINSIVEDLNKKGLDATGFHGNSSLEDESAYSAWFSDKVKILVTSTYALGLGISKSNIRFVIHSGCLCLSLEEYYQQSGRAGHDGLPSYCRVYYNYADKGFMLHRIEEQQMKMYSDQLRHRYYNFMNYLQNECDCRHKLIVQALGEEVGECKNCDNCSMKGPKKEIVEKDYTEDAKNLLNIVKKIGDKYTLLFCIDIWRGSKNKKITEKKFHRLAEHESGKHLPEQINERIAGILLAKGCLREETVSATAGKGYYARVSLDARKSEEVFNGTVRITCSILSVIRTEIEPELKRTVFPKTSAKQTTLFDFAKKKTATPALQKSPPTVIPKTQVTPTQPTASKQFFKLLPPKINPENETKILLVKLRDSLQKMNSGIQPDQIISAKAIDEISQKQPKTLSELLQLEHFPILNIINYGLEVLKTIRQFRAIQLKDGIPINELEEKQIREELSNLQVALTKKEEQNITPDSTSMEAPQQENGTTAISESASEETSKLNLSLDTSILEEFMNDPLIDAELDAKYCRDELAVKVEQQQQSGVIKSEQQKQTVGYDFWDDPMIDEELNTIYGA